MERLTDEGRVQRGKVGYVDVRHGHSLFTIASLARRLASRGRHRSRVRIEQLAIGV